MNKDLDLILDELQAYCTKYGIPQIDEDEDDGVTYTYPLTKYSNNSEIEICITDSLNVITVQVAVYTGGKLYAKCILDTLCDDIRLYDARGNHLLKWKSPQTVSKMKLNVLSTCSDIAKILDDDDLSDMLSKYVEVFSTNAYKKWDELDWCETQFYLIKSFNDDICISYFYPDYYELYLYIDIIVKINNNKITEIEDLRENVSPRRRVRQRWKNRFSEAYDIVRDFLGNDLKVSKQQFMESLGYTKDELEPLQESYRYRKTPRLRYRNRK